MFRHKLEIIYINLVRSVKLWVRFKISFLFSLIAMFFNIAIFFFLGIVFGPAADIAVIEYGGNFFSFILVGLAFNQFITIAITDYLKAIRGAYWSNWLELILSSKMGLITFFVSMLSWDYLYSTLNVIIFLIMGLFVFGAKLVLSSGWYIIIFILFLTIISLSGIGLVAASIFMLKGARGDIEPISWSVIAISALVSGVYYPVEKLPQFMQVISKIIPQTYALRGIRLILLNGENIYNIEIQSIIIILIIFSLILLPSGVLIFKRGIKKAEKDGTLARWI